MFRKVLQSKIHRATVTHADLHYEGSISLPIPLLEATGILPYEAVSVWNVTNGERFETYAIEGIDEGSISINGAAARLVAPGDIVIVASFCYIEGDQVGDFRPNVVFVDDRNRIREIREEIPGPLVRV